MFPYTLDMIDIADWLSEVFGRIKLNKKGSRNIYFFLHKKVIPIKRSML